jgi:flagellar hook-associated protein 3 FlgL
MRISENTNYTAIQEHIGKARTKMDRLSNHAATLRRIVDPSDDPVGSMKILENRTHLANQNQFLYNARLAQAFLESTDTALADISEALIRCKEIALQSASDPSSNEESRKGLAQEVHTIYQQAVNIANRKLGDRYLFGGYKVTKPPVDQEGIYHGDNGNILVEIGKGAYIGINITGFDVFNTNINNIEEPHNLDIQENINIFEEIKSLKQNLLTSDIQNVRQSIERIEEIYSKVVMLRAKIGSRLSGIDSNVRSLDKQIETSTGFIAQLEDADLAEIITDLSRQESIYKNALASSRRLIHPTLLDFLK